MKNWESTEYTNRYWQNKETWSERKHYTRSVLKTYKKNICTTNSYQIPVSVTKTLRCSSRLALKLFSHYLQYLFSTLLKLIHSKTYLLLTGRKTALGSKLVDWWWRKSFGEEIILVQLFSGELKRKRVVRPPCVSQYQDWNLFVACLYIHTYISTCMAIKWQRHAQGKRKNSVNREIIISLK